MQNLVSREVSAQETAVLTVGQIVAGTKHNIIPATATMRGSLRTFSPAVREQVKERLGAYARDIARAYRAEATLGFMGEGCPGVVNHERETALVRARSEERRVGEECRGRGSPSEAEEGGSVK